MPFKKHKRQSVRLRGYDYTSVGAYFITVCTKDRQCLFGKVIKDEMVLNKAGWIAANSWQEIPGHFVCVTLDIFIVMPNHIHGIIIINNRRGTACHAPTRERFSKPVSGSIPTVIRSFKSAVTKRINVLRQMSVYTVWQRNYFERIIRNEAELRQMKLYISHNPLQWDLDKNNPKNH